MAADRTESRTTPAISPLLLQIRNEYREMPGLNLTEVQARRLWSLDGSTCRAALAMLLDQRFLRRTARGTYIRVSAEAARGRRR